MDKRNRDKHYVNLVKELKTIDSNLSSYIKNPPQLQQDDILDKERIEKVNMFGCAFRGGVNNKENEQRSR